MIRLDEKQYRAVKKMTRAACANNDCGNCLLLDGMSDKGIRIVTATAREITEVEKAED